MSSLRKVKSIQKTLLLCLVVLGAIPNLHGMRGRSSRRRRAQQSTSRNSVDSHVYIHVDQPTNDTTDNVSRNSSKNNSGDSSGWSWKEIATYSSPYILMIASNMYPRVMDYFYGDPELKEASKEDRIATADLKRQRVKLQSQKGWGRLELREKREKVCRSEMALEGQAFMQDLQIFKAREEQLKAAINSREKAETPEEIQFYDLEIQTIIDHEDFYSMRPFDELEFEED